MKKLEDAIMRLEAMFSNRCKPVLRCDILLQSPATNMVFPEKSPSALMIDQIRSENMEMAKKPKIMVFMTAVFRHPSEGRRSDFDRPMARMLRELRSYS